VPVRGDRSNPSHAGVYEGSALAEALPERQQESADAGIDLNPQFALRRQRTVIASAGRAPCTLPGFRQR
jgi:hypothetical protein